MTREEIIKEIEETEERLRELKNTTLDVVFFLFFKADVQITCA